MPVRILRLKRDCNNLTRKFGFDNAVLSLMISSHYRTFGGLPNNAPKRLFTANGNYKEDFTTHNAEDRCECHAS